MQRTLDSLWLQNEIEQRGYAELAHGIPNEYIEVLVDAYTNFTLAHPDPYLMTMDAMLPSVDDISKLLDELDYTKDKQRHWHKYRTNTPGVGKPDGYTNRGFQVRVLEACRDIMLPEEDDKEYYHFTPRHRAKVGRAHIDYEWGKVPSEVDRLDTAFTKIHAAASSLMLKMCSEIEELHPELTTEVTKDSILGSPLRLLFYHPSSKPQRAGNHYDKSLLTLQIAESHQGLQVATKEGAPLAHINRDPEHAVIFASHALSGKGLHGKDAGLFPDSPFQPAWHGVVADNRVNKGRFVPDSAQGVCARWALVYFLNKDRYVMPDKTTMHTRK